MEFILPKEWENSKRAERSIRAIKEMKDKNRRYGTWAIKTENIIAPEGLEESMQRIGIQLKIIIAKRDPKEVIRSLPRDKNTTGME